MSLKVACNFCEKTLVISETFAGKRIKCPSCKNPILVDLIDEQPDESVADDSKLSIGEPAKKRKKKKRIKNQSEDNSVWIWWTLGSLSVALLIYILYYSAVHGDSLMTRYYAMNLLVMCPISLIMFFATVLLCNVLLGEIEIGYIHSAIFKAIFVVLCANTVSLFPCGFFISLATWFILLIAVFQFDPWEARLLVFANWALNFCLKLIVFSVLTSKIMSDIENSDENNANPAVDKVQTGTMTKPRQVVK